MLNSKASNCHLAIQNKPSIWITTYHRLALPCTVCKTKMTINTRALKSTNSELKKIKVTKEKKAPTY